MDSGSRIEQGRMGAGVLILFLLSGEHTLKNHRQLPTLVGAFTDEAQPIGSAVGG